jgi:hypothetical protein
MATRLLSFVTSDKGTRNYLAKPTSLLLSAEHHILADH